MQGIAEKSPPYKTNWKLAENWLRFLIKFCQNLGNEICYFKISNSLKIFKSVVKESQLKINSWCCHFLYFRRSVCFQTSCFPRQPLVRSSFHVFCRFELIVVDYLSVQMTKQAYSNHRTLLLLRFTEINFFVFVLLSVHFRWSPGSTVLPKNPPILL